MFMFLKLDGAGYPYPQQNPGYPPPQEAYNPGYPPPYSGGVPPGRYKLSNDM